MRILKYEKIYGVKTADLGLNGYSGEYGAKTSIANLDELKVNTIK